MRSIVTVLLCVVSFNILAVPERDTETLADETFDVWHRAGDDFMFYCKQPCAAEDEAIQAYYMNFLGYLPELIDWHGVDVIDELKPVEMHLNESSVCPQQSGAVGYAKVGFHRGWEDRRGVTCLFEIERGEDLAERNHVLSLHEYAHVILFDRHRWSYEYFTYWSSWELVDPDSPFGDPCDDWYEQFDFIRPVHRLCRDHGLNREVVRDTLIELDRRFRAEEGFLSNHTEGGYTTTLAEMRGLFDAALEADTAPAFQSGGWSAERIGVDFSVGPNAALYSAVADHIRIDVPQGALAETTALRLDKPSSAQGFLPSSYLPRAFAIVRDGEADRGGEPLAFDQPLRLAIQPESFFLSNRPHTDYHLVEQHFGPGMRPYWRPVEGSHFDPETGMVVGDIDGTGQYSYGPRFRGPAGMFYDPDFNGHGFDIQMVGEEVFVIFFTYDSDGQPFWLLGHAPLGNVPMRSHSAVEMSLWLYQRPDDGGALLGSEIGHLELQFFGGWGAGGWDIGVNAQVSLDGITGDQSVFMALRPLGFGNAVGAAKQVTGHWFDPADSGWGLTIDRKGETEVAVAYFYDADGFPRWALGNREIDEPITQVLVFDGYCLTCEVKAPDFEVAGNLALEFEAGGRSGAVDLDVAWPADAEQRWSRPSASIVPLSDPPEFRYMPESTTSASARSLPNNPPAESLFDANLRYQQETTCLHWHHPELPLGLGPRSH
jgi:hypothetical protein